MLVIHLDKYYLGWGKLFLLSAAKNAPGEEVYISAANLTLREMLWLEKFHPAISIRNHEIVVPKTIEYRRYMQCRITKVLLEVYDAYKDQDRPIIAMNADMLIRKPMDALSKITRVCDFAIKFDEEHLSICEIQNGVIAFNTGNRSVLPFLEHYNSMWDEGTIKNRDDQRQLYRSYYKFREFLTFFSLPHDYIDGKFKPDSHIWSAHVHDRFYNYNVFLKELGLPLETVCPYPKEWGVPC